MVNFNGSTEPLRDGANIDNSSIDTLHLNIQQDGCVISYKAEQNFNFRPGDRFPSLRELSLTGYQFNEYPRPSIQSNIQDGLYHFWWWLADFTGAEWLRPIPEIGQDDQAVNLLKWKEAMDWTKVRDLSLDKVDAVFLESMQGQLPALEFLELDFLHSHSCLRKNITDFIVQSRPLRRLSLRGHTKGINLTEILDRHGDSIETLKIHEWEGNHFLRPTLSRSDLEQITQKCPSLSKLGLDINRNGTWPV